MDEMPMAVMLASVSTKVEVDEEGCWIGKWSKPEFLGYEMGTLLFGIGRGLIGRGAVIRKCGKNEVCVNPYHWEASYTHTKTRTHCKWGHELIKPNGRCRVCDRIKKAKWRAKKKLEIK